MKMSDNQRKAMFARMNYGISGKSEEQLSKHLTSYLTGLENLKGSKLIGNERKELREIYRDEVKSSTSDDRVFTITVLKKGKIQQVIHVQGLDKTFAYVRASKKMGFDTDFFPVR